MTYQELVKRGREAASSQWTLGDLALEVETSYADHTLEKFADDIGVVHKTLENYRYVASRYDEKSRRRENSFAVHDTFAAQEDRLELIKRKWTAQEARDEVAKRIAARAGSKSRPETTTDKETMAERLAGDNLVDFYDWLMRQGEARMTETATTIRLFVQKR